MSQTHHIASQPASRFQQVITEWKQLAYLGTPILIAELSLMANGVIDTIMAGHASANDLAAVGIGTSIWIPFLLFFCGILNALQPIISARRGANDFMSLVPTTWQGIYVAMVCSFLLAFIVIHAHPLFGVFSLDAHTAQIAQGYLFALAFGAPAVLILNALRGFTDGMGHTRIIMAFSLLSTLLNIPFNYLFIFGFTFYGWQIDAMGGVGCGWATTLSNWIALGALITYLTLSKTYRTFHLFNHFTAPAWQEIKAILRIGLPIGFAMFVEVSMFWMIALFLSPLGAHTIAAHQIVLNSISLFFMLPLSLGMALTLRVSFLLGADEPAKASLLARSALLLALSIACINAPVLYFGGEFIARLYTNDASVIAIAVKLFALGAIFQVVDVIQVTMMSVLRGYKDTQIPMVIMLFSFWFVCLPLGYVLAFMDWIYPPAGAAGFWTALIIGLTCAAILLSVRVFNYQLRRSVG